MIQYIHFVIIFILDPACQLIDKKRSCYIMDPSCPLGDYGTTNEITNATNGVLVALFVLAVITIIVIFLYYKRELRKKKAK